VSKSKSSTQSRWIGAHMSIAGGYYKSVVAAAKCHMTCVQLFTKNNNQWRAKDISAAEVEEFQLQLRELQIEHPLSHASYLINLGSGSAELWDKSVASMVVELQRASQLGIAGVVMHPGAHPGQTEAEGIANIIRGIDAIHNQLPNCASQILLETTAGQGTSIGHTFEQLAAILQNVQFADRLGICVDTCHIFAAGYGLQQAHEYEETFALLDKHVDLQRIRAFHINDSKKERGSRVDRHEHIGQGKLGLEPFRHLMNDTRFTHIPMYLETPKGTNPEGEDNDIMNMNTLRSLIVE
jgi:deoxyribonuclease IV